MVLPLLELWKISKSSSSPNFNLSLSPNVAVEPNDTSPVKVDIPLTFKVVKSVGPTLYLSVPDPTVPLVSLLTISIQLPA